MNKKLLFAAMSLAALTACTDNDFESQKVAEEVGSVQFEVLNNDDAFTRASLNGNKVEFSANDGDLFTLYHGAAVEAVTGYQNATYKASAAEGVPAALTTPSVILPGGAIMVWPADTTFRIKSDDDLTIKIPVVQGGKVKVNNVEKETIQNQIPYVSDQIEIENYAAYSETAEPGVIPTAYKTAGYDRKYKIFMRPMASQLNLVADYAGTDATLATLYSGDDAIDEIKVTSVELLTTNGGGATNFTKEIPVKFSAPVPATSQWGTVANNKWVKVTDFDVEHIAAGIAEDKGQTDKLITKCLTGNSSSKFLILPQAKIYEADATKGVENAGVVVNTIYGKVVIADGNAHGSKYTTTGDNAEIKDAWYRFLSAKPATEAHGETTKATAEASGEHAGKFKCTSKPEFGLKQTINGFSAYKATSGVATGEPVGASATRYVKVLLTHLDMTDLHIKNDKQLRDVARVWEKLGLDDVTVYLDGGQEDDAEGEFTISQKTIAKINEINAAAEGKAFKVMPCNVAGEKCNTIVITGASDIQTLQDIAFIEKGDNGTPADNTDDITCKVVLKNDATPWKWNVNATTKIASIKVQETAVEMIINKGTILNDADATIKTLKKDGTSNDVRLINDNIWNVTAGTLKVQFDVTNNGTLTISEGAEYRQDGTGHVFSNMALTLPERFLAEGVDEQVGLVNNNGVFATVDGGQINNYGLIEHLKENAKTYITTNERTGDFSTAFKSTNKMGRINLKYPNKDEDNISISATAPITQGFVSVTVDGDAEGTVLNNDAVGTYVNYIIIKRGIEKITNLDPKIKYVEIDQPNTEIAWELDPAVSTTATYDGLMVLSNVNIKLGTTIKVTKGVFLDDNATMYVGGTFKIKDADPTAAGFKTYYGDKSANFATNYVTF